MRFWWDYRTAWAQKRSLLPLAVTGAVFVVAGVVGTVLMNPIAVFFIPGLICLIAHHMLVQRQVG